MRWQMLASCAESMMYFGTTMLLSRSANRTRRGGSAQRAAGDAQAILGSCEPDARLHHSGGILHQQCARSQAGRRHSFRQRTTRHELPWVRKERSRDWGSGAPNVVRRPGQRGGSGSVIRETAAWLGSDGCQDCGPLPHWGLARLIWGTTGILATGRIEGLTHRIAMPRITRYEA